MMDVITSQSSNDRRAFLISDAQFDYIDQGYGYALEQNFTIAAGGTMSMLIDYTTYTDLSPSSVDRKGAQRRGVIAIMPPHFVSTTGPIEVNVYRGTNYTGGTAVHYSKLNTLSDADPQVTITSGATGTTKGDIVLEYLVGAVGAAKGGRAAGVATFFRDNSDKTLVEVINNSGAEATFHYGQVFYEI